MKDLDRNDLIGGLLLITIGSLVALYAGTQRTLLLSRGDLMVFLERPISAAALTFTAGLIAWSVWSHLQRRDGASKPAEAVEARAA